jgi:molybdate transport system ATP-binding protein
MTIDVSVSHRLGDFILEVEFSSKAGVTALFGRSGSGKTTLLNMVAGLVTPAQGTIAIGGETLFSSMGGINLPAHRRGVGYVFQEGRLLPHLTVRQNMLYGRFFNGHRSDSISLDNAANLLGIESLMERRPLDLSGGEKQRVAIGRALLANPRVLLMDEPLASVDAGRKSEILYYVERLRDETEIPIIYVTHALEEVVRLAERVVLLSNGRVSAIGTVAEIMSRIELRPQLGRFEGGAVIEARVAAQDLESGLARLEFPGGVLHAPDLDALVGEVVRVRIRARDVSLALEPPRASSILNCLRGRVIEIGDEATASVDVRLDVEGHPLIARVTRHSISRLKLAAGSEVYALVKAVSLDRHSVGFA